jgi:ATP-dependent DNA ligase
LYIKDPQGDGFVLDPQIVLPKPKSEISDADVEVLIDHGCLLTARKRDGHTAPILITGSKQSDVKIMTAQYHDVTAKFPHLVDAVCEVGWSSGTVAQAEILLPNKNGIDDRTIYQRLAGSGAANAIALQSEIGLAELVFFNLWMENDQSLVTTPYQERYTRLGERLSSSCSPHVSLVEIVSGSFAGAQSQVLENNWEGLVLYDKTAGSHIRTDGKHHLIPRPVGCWKWKPIKEDVFVITGWVPSTAAAHAGAVKEFKIAQHHPTTGELIPCGVVGKGFSRADRYKYADDSLYPLVAEIEFENRTKAGKLFHSTLSRFRTDKTPPQCIFPDSLL